LAPTAVEERFSEVMEVDESCPEALDEFLEENIEVGDSSNVDLRLERSNTSEFSVSSRNLRCDKGSEEGENIENYYCTPTTEDLEIEYSELNDDGDILEQRTLLLEYIELDSDKEYLDYMCDT